VINSFPGILATELILLLICLPLGFAVLRVAERLLSTLFRLSPIERALAAFYTTGATLFVLASIPLPIFGTTLVAGALTVGAVVYAALLLREHGRSWCEAIDFGPTPAGLLLIGGLVGLLVFELVPVWNHPFPNAWDGSATALWMTLTLTHHTLPTNLAPFSNAPVFYPLGTTVWMTVPVTLFGWSNVRTIVLLPPLFLSFTVLAAYCWGVRWAGTTVKDPEKAGLLFAGFFGLVASWPRLYTGGSYDFAFALPLLLMGLAVLPALVRHEPRYWREIAGFGLFAGVVTSLSVAAGEALLGFLIGFVLLVHWRSSPHLARWMLRAAVVGGIAVAWVSRSLWELSAPNPSAYSAVTATSPFDLQLVQGALDPFVVFKPLISPFPSVAVLLQILLGAGLALAVYSLVKRSRTGFWSFRYLLRTDLLAGTVMAFGMTVVLLLTDLPGTVPQRLREASNLPEGTVVLMLFYSALALLPLLAALAFLVRYYGSSSERAMNGRRPLLRRPFTVDRDVVGRGKGYLAGAVAILVISLPLALGAAVTLSDGTSSIQQNVDKTSNVTSSDVAALQWAGSTLPPCSRVLVAPGSAGQFLPEYATVGVVFPMNPVPTNASYVDAVAYLTHGQYSAQTRSDLLALSITEVFVTGPTSVSYPAFQAAAFQGSPDFVLEFESDDAMIFEFLPGVGSAGCNI
jgi:hypothetical protein